MTVRHIARRITTQASRRATRILTGTFNSVTRRYAVRRAYLTRRAEAHNATLAESGIYTAAQYLRRVIGATPEFVAANAVRFGKAAARAHRALFGASPAQGGLTVIGNHPRFTSIATYGPAAHAALEQAATTLNGADPTRTPETPAATIDPATLATEITTRRFEATGPLAKTCRMYVAQRVADIVAGMHRTPANYDVHAGCLTVAGAELVKQIIGADAASGYAWREIGQMVEDANSLPIAALIGA